VTLSGKLRRRERSAPGPIVEYVGPNIFLKIVHFFSMYFVLTHFSKKITINSFEIGYNEGTGTIQ
jgi:hypothetical protein